MNLADIPGDLIEQARMIVALSETVALDDIAAMLMPWMQEDRDRSAKVMLCLALMADKDKLIKQGHAAYMALKNRGEPIPESVAELHREYDRKRKEKSYRYIKGEGA